MIQSRGGARDPPRTMTRNRFEYIATHPYPSIARQSARSTLVDKESGRATGLQITERAAPAAWAQHAHGAGLIYANPLFLRACDFHMPDSDELGLTLVGARISFGEFSRKKLSARDGLCSQK
jgi:hypothetical protein